jgi:hypothetical protein
MVEGLVFAPSLEFVKDFFSFLSLSCDECLARDARDSAAMVEAFFTSTITTGVGREEVELLFLLNFSGTFLSFTDSFLAFLLPGSGPPPAASRAPITPSTLPLGPPVLPALATP